MKEESGLFEGATLGVDGVVLPASSSEMILCAGVEVDSQFLVVSSSSIRLRIRGSGTSDPEFMKVLALIPE